MSVNARWMRGYHIRQGSTGEPTFVLLYRLANICRKGDPLMARPEAQDTRGLLRDLWMTPA